MDEQKELLLRQTMESMIHTDHRHRALCDRELASVGLHRSQNRMLAYLSQHGGAVSQRQIADDMQITPAVVTVTLKKLMQDGYVIRRPAAHDGRSYEIAISESGQAIVNRSRAILYTVDARMFRGFTEAELKQMTEFYGRMLDNLRSAEKGE